MNQVIVFLIKNNTMKKLKISDKIYEFSSRNIFELLMNFNFSHFLPYIQSVYEKLDELVLPD